MIIHLVGLLALTALAGGTPTARHPRAAKPPTSPMRVSANDNRRPAGVQRGGRLTLRLVARTGMWHPDGDGAPGMVIPAFAEEGGAPLIPGPMIRVRAGTTVTVTVRNDIEGATLAVHGFVSHLPATPVSGDSLLLPPGSTHVSSIQLNVPGTYYYWGTTTARAMDDRTREDAQLSGAIIVDDADGPRPVDRVIVLGMLADTAGRWFMVRKTMLAVMNGRSWPHTERLTYATGDTVHWRIINTTADLHPMHLHGFYFSVDSRGDGRVDTTYAPGERDNVVTNLMRPGATMRMSWTPERAGNWLFHCHLPAHFSPRGPLGAVHTPVREPAHHLMNHALEGMNGLVMGVTVRASTGRSATVPTAVATNERGRRQLRLVVRPRSDGSPASPNFSFSLDDGTVVAGPIPRDNLAPALVLTRAQPVSITVVNALAEPTAVHWHGIELESYYDGVAGFSGQGRRLSPVIAPGDSFVALFTPPRAGTFIYHTHIDEERQQPAGLAGPIIVLEPGAHRDPATDVTVVASSPRTHDESSGRLSRIAWLNGAAAPAPLQFQAGVHHRMRLINMTTGIPGLRFELAQKGRLVRWRPIAKDGADLPESRRIMRIARQPVSIGETLDVDVVPEEIGTLLLTARLGDGTVAGEMAVHVGAARP